MPITVGSVEVDVFPSTTGIYERLRDALVPAATRAGEEAGTAAGRAIGQRISTQVGSSVADGLRAGGARSRPAATRAGDDAGGAFGRVFRARVEAAMRSLPRANVGLDATGFDAQMDRLRARLETLSNRRIGVDVSAADAMAELDRVQARLVELGAGHTDVNVRVDVARAAAELDAFRADIARVDGQHVEVDADADTGRAVSAFGNLVTAAAAFGPAIIPILPIVAAGLGGVAAAGIAAAVGIGGIAAVAIPAFHSISSALQLQKAAQTASNSSTSSGAATAIQMAGAQQALASAVRNGAQQVASARDQVAQAERGVQDAEKALTQSQTAARQAQESLTEARKTAAQQLQDLASSYANAQLSQRNAALQLTEAETALNAVKADPKATQLQRAEAQLAYDQAKQQLADQTVATGRLKDQQAAAAKAGVEGTDVYKQAQDALAQAQDEVVAKSQAVVDARAGVAKAERQVAQAQASAADSIASAQRQIAQVQQQAAVSASAAGQAQRAYQKALADMSPATRATYMAFLGLRTAFGAWSKSLQPAVMPIFTRALDGLARVLPGLTPFVLAAADAVSGLQDKLGKETKAPWAKSLKDDLGKSVGPAITGIGIAVGNIFKGAAGVVDAFLPHVDKAGKTVDGWTGKFAKWGTSLKGSPKFEGFIDYVKREAPIVGQAVGKIFTAVFKAVQAFAPISGISLGLLTGIATAIGLIPAPVLTALALGFVALALGLKAAAIAQGLLNTEMELNPIGAVIALIVALVVIFVYAWQNSATFRDIVKGAFAAVQAAVQAVISWFTQSFIPFFTQTIPGAFTWLLNWVKAHWPLLLGILTGPVGLAVWAILHYWSQISGGFSSGWSWIKTNVLYPIRDFFTKAIPGWATSLSDHVVGAFSNMGSGVASAWGKIEDAAKNPINFVIGTVWNKGILGVWDKITGWIPGLPKMGKLPLLEAGGVLPVRPGVFNKPTAIVGEGNSCIGRGSLIQTGAGLLPIEDVKAGQEVLTRNGYRLVKWSGLTRPDTDVLSVTTSAGNRVICTPDHRIWTARGSVDGKRRGDRLGGWAVRGRGLHEDYDAALRDAGVCDVPSDDGQGHSPTLRGHSGVGSTHRADRSRTEAQTNLLGGHSGTCSGEAPIDRVPALVRGASIVEGAGAVECHRGVGCSCDAQGTLLQARASVVGGEHLREPSRHPCMQDLQEGRGPRVDAREACRPGVPCARQREEPGISTTEACWREAQDLEVGDWVWSLGADGHLAADRVVGVAPAQRVDTFDLTVEGEHEFIAEGILVHNSHPEFVIPTDPKYRGRALALLQQAGAQMLAGGGILGGIAGGAKAVGGAVAGAAKGAWSGIKTAADFIKDPVGNLLKLLNPITDKLKPLTSPWGKVAAGLPRAAIEGLKHLVGIGGSSTGGGKIPSGEHAQIISQALAAAHVPPPGTLVQWLTGMNTLIQRESGWHANSINLWDSNAKAGHPSQGLTQTIPGTWAHYVPAAFKGRGILDPVGNVAASVRYIVSRYGNITGVQQADASRPPKGYDSGGYLAPGLNLAYNGTGRPEPVFTSQQANGLMRLATAPTGGGGGEFTGDLYLDSGEFLGKVRGEVQQGMTALASTLRAGRKG